MSKQTGARNTSCTGSSTPSIHFCYRDDKPTETGGASMRTMSLEPDRATPRKRLPASILLLGALLLPIVAPALPATAIAPRSEAARQADRPASVAPAEFARIVNEFSEDGRYFWSDNLISNETSYLPIIPRLRELGASGGAYIGVGPEQNFTYIAKVRPQIAFIIDIRRQAMIQHMMFKALFHLSPDRRQFLSRLL